MNTILLVDDEPAILQMLGSYLGEKYNIRRAINGNTAINFIKQYAPDLIVVDWMLPDISGVNIISWVRNNKLYKDTPIILLTAKSTEQDKLKGFDAGADDYLVKPFLLSELNARIKSLLRRAATDEQLIKINQLTINLDSYTVYVDNNKIKLNVKEFNALKIMAKTPNRVYSREQLIDLVWGSNSNISARAVDVCITRIRKALSQYDCELITTIRGVGYSLTTQEQENG